MVTFIELAFASACASVRAPTINETATSGAAENCSAAVLRSTPNWLATARSRSRLARCPCEMFQLFLP